MEISKQIIEQEEKVRKLWVEDNYIKYRVESHKLLELQSIEDTIIALIAVKLITLCFLISGLVIYLFG